MENVYYLVKPQCIFNNTIRPKFFKKPNITTNTLSPLLVNVTLTKVMRSVQKNNRKIKIGETTFDVLGFVDESKSKSNWK